MRSILSKTGKFILGFFLFTVGLGLVYVGCSYMNSMVSGVLKKIDTIIYIICFIPSLIGLGYMLEALNLIKPKEEKAKDSQQVP